MEISSFDIRLQQMLGIFYTLRWIPIQTGILRGLPVDGRKDIRAGGCLESSEVLYSRVGELLRNVQVPPPPRERWQARWLDSDGMCKLGSSLRARVPKKGPVSFPAPTCRCPAAQFVSFTQVWVSFERSIVTLIRRYRTSDFFQKNSS